MKNIAIVTHSIGVGGIGKAVINIANHWASLGRNVAVVLLSPEPEPAVLSLDSRVRQIALDMSFLRRPAVPRIFGYLVLFQRLRHALKERHPDVIVSFMDWINVITLIAVFGLKTPVVVSERGDPARPGLATPVRVARFFLYRRAKALVAVSQGVLDRFSLRRGQISSVIPGVSYPPDSRTYRRRDRSSEPRVLIAAGRLVPEKGFDLLIRAYSAIAPRNPEWVLHIWGDGPERERLCDMIKNLGVEGQIVMKGLATDIYAVMASSDLFVFSSRSGYDGFPNVIAEALLSGLPAVSFDCREGPREIIESGINGFLVPDEDVESLSGALEKLMTDAELRAKFSAEGSRILEKCGHEVVMGKWEAVLAGCLEKT